MKAIRNIFIFLMTVWCAFGCSSMARDRELFIDERKFDVGRVVDRVPVPEPYDISNYDDEHNKYYYEYKKTNCRWYYKVSNSTKKIVSWGYVSNPENCYLEYNWFGPW